MLFKFETMKGFYLLINVGLCGMLTLASCGEDEVVNVNPGVEEAEQSDYTVQAAIVQPDVVVGTDSPNGVCWNAGDAFTLWNRNTGKAYDFTISASYDGSVPSAAAEFTGKAALQNDPKVLAVFPRRDAKVLNDLVTLSIPDTCKWSSTNEYNYRSASASVVDGQLPVLSFESVTSGLQINLKSVSDKDVQVAYVTLEGFSNLFPGTVTLNEEGVVNTLLDARKGVTVDMEGQTLPAGGMLSCHLNVLPTTTGTESLMRSTTELVLKVTLLQNEALQEMTVWKGSLKELPLENEASMDETAYQFYPGAEYLLAVNVNDFAMPEGGFMQDAEGVVHIYSADGLTAWSNRAAEFGDSRVVIEKNFLAGNVIQLNEWVSVPEFTGTFDGNNVVIEGTFINSRDKNYGFIGVNKGTVKNLCFADASLNVDASDAFAGVIVGKNEGLVQNCVVTGTSKLIATASGDGNLGMIAGYNAGTVSASYVEGESVVEYNGRQVTSSIGGLVGWNNGGTVTGCYTLAMIYLNTAANAGGLIGSTFSNAGKGSVVGASYAAGKVIVQGNGWAVGGLIGNGESYDEARAAVVRGCYSLTELPESGKVGGLSAKGTGNSLSFQECYYMNSAQAVNGQADVPGTAKLDVPEALVPHAADMNLAVTGSGFQFVENKDEAGKVRQPLVVRQEEAGNEGPGFGDGGEI